LPFLTLPNSYHRSTARRAMSVEILSAGAIENACSIREIT